jgi:hypothetical protein
MLHEKQNRIRLLWPKYSTDSLILFPFICNKFNKNENNNEGELQFEGERYFKYLLGSNMLLNEKPRTIIYWVWLFTRVYRSSLCAAEIYFTQLIFSFEVIVVSKHSHIVMHYWLSKSSSYLPRSKSMMINLLFFSSASLNCH